MKDFSIYQNCQALVCTQTCTLEMFESYHFQAGQVYTIEVADNLRIIIFPEFPGCYFHCQDQDDYLLLTTNFTTKLL